MKKIFCLVGVLLFSVISAQEVRIHTLSQEKGLECLKGVSYFYNMYYRDPPYYYDASEEAWDRYIHSFIDYSGSVLCVATLDQTVIGVAIGTPLAKTTQKYNAAFKDLPEDLNTLFFLGELAVQPEYQHLGVGQQLYAEFERQVAEKNQFSGICVWSMESEVDRALGHFWRDVGFTCSEVRFEELWKDTFGTEKVPHSMVCWKKSLQN